jgi:hypothetical protein
MDKNDPGEQFNPGDVMIWGADGVESTGIEADPRVVGVYSDTYGFCLGGDPSYEDINDNLKDKVPVGVSGRVLVNAVGPVEIGNLLCTSNIPKYAQRDTKNIPGTRMGKALQKLSEGQRKRIWMLVMHC